MAGAARERIATLEHAGLSFEITDEGPLDAGPEQTVVLLHGFPERRTSWRLVAPLLHAAGLRTLALDQRGYSPGARPTRRRDYTLDLLVGDAAALLTRLRDDLGGPVHLAGHDWGSVVGWGLANRHAELVCTYTAVSVPHPRAFTSREAMRSGQALKSWYMALFQVPLVVELAAGHTPIVERWLRSSGMSAEEVARFRREIVEDGALPHALGWYRALPLTARGGGFAGRTRVPTTFVWSTRDVAVARAGAEQTAAFVEADYEFVELDGVSHWIPTQAPEALAEAILRRIQTAGAA